jgi:hypothetical protein
MGRRMHRGEPARGRVHVRYRRQLGIRQGRTANVETEGWGRIDPSTSLWTLEAGRTLTLHLDKADAGRWAHVWARDDNVDETLDPLIIAERAAAMPHRSSATEAAPYGMCVCVCVRVAVCVCVCVRVRVCVCMCVGVWV